MNILLFIADDYGLDKYRGTKHPHLDRLQDRGTHYQMCWSHPLCSPSRASIYTGVPPYRHGIGWPLDAGGGLDGSLQGGGATTR